MPRSLGSYPGIASSLALNLKGAARTSSRENSQGLNTDIMTLMITYKAAKIPPRKARTDKEVVF